MKAINAIKYFFDAFLYKNEKSEFSRYVLAKKICEAIYPKFKFSSFGRTFLEDKEFVDYYRNWISELDFSSLDRRYTLDQLIRHTLLLEGDTAECGVFKGGSSYLVCRHLKGTRKQHHIFDSFEGISKPKGEDEGCAWGSGEFCCPEEQVRENLKEFDFVNYYKGWIPDRFQDVADRKFSFVHVDVDLFQPTYDSLAFFYPRLVSGAILLCDDYGMIQAPGAKRAMDQFFADKNEPVVSLTTGQGLIIKS